MPRRGSHSDSQVDEAPRDVAAAVRRARKLTRAGDHAESAGLDRGVEIGIP
jgi:hypothetical protein